MAEKEKKAKKVGAALRRAVGLKLPEGEYQVEADDVVVGADGAVRIQTHISGGHYEEETIMFSFGVNSPIGLTRLKEFLVNVLQVPGAAKSYSTADVKGKRFGICVDGQHRWTYSVLEEEKK